MKKTAIIAILLAFALVLAGCGDKNANDDSKQGEEDNVPTSASGDAFTFKSGSVEVKMNAEAESIISGLGEYNSYFEAESCAFEGMDKTYSYSGFDVTTYTLGGVDYISGVVIMDDTVETPEGITIGSSVDDVKDAYGDVEDGATSVTFNKGDCQLLILLENGSVTSVQYIAVTD